MALDILKDTAICETLCILGSVLLFGGVFFLFPWITGVWLTLFWLEIPSVALTVTTTTAYFSYRNNLQ